VDGQNRSRGITVVKSAGHIRYRDNTRSVRPTVNGSAPENSGTLFANAGNFVFEVWTNVCKLVSNVKATADDGPRLVVLPP